MDIRIGVTHSPREISLEVADDAGARDALRKAVEAAVAGESAVLWVTDKKGREVAVPTARIAFVEIGSPDSGQRIGFGG